MTECRAREVAQRTENGAWHGRPKATPARTVPDSAFNWMESMLADLLFLKRFHAARDPWKDLAAIHASVLEDFAPARRLGLRLFSGQLPAR